MSKITITIDGKTYTTNPHAQAYNSVNYIIKKFIDKGFLEEVKENEEKAQFTPGQMIEVSDDKIRWKPVIFNHFNESSRLYWDDNWKYYLFARQPQEDTELPDFDYLKITQGENYKFATLAKQVELITDRLNQLIKANNHL